MTKKPTKDQHTTSAPNDQDNLYREYVEIPMINRGLATRPKTTSQSRLSTWLRRLGKGWW
jgi:hypothetical protein